MRGCKLQNTLKHGQQSWAASSSESSSILHVAAPGASLAGKDFCGRLGYILSHIALPRSPKAHPRPMPQAPHHIIRGSCAGYGEQTKLTMCHAKWIQQTLKKVTKNPPTLTNPSLFPPPSAERAAPPFSPIVRASLVNSAAGKGR